MQPAAVYNPNTKEVRFLPNPNEGIDKSWRDTQNIFPCVPYYMPSVCTSGAIYKFAMADYISIVAFELNLKKSKLLHCGMQLNSYTITT
ncbi:hypothetical protein MTR67_002863 [Solanum verrucosum]|uniref:Uncharacterized protein n=1 Tax=Solanum verrucosum TaxID=315347 RepID=A0AAF0PR04_SOLVR|nr:hypothetical protein MTR67_002863 [Solanum verrucosum]